MNTTTSAYNLTSILAKYFGGQPATVACPIQTGLPAFLTLARDLLLWLAVAAFLFGIVSAVFNYLTAFGSDDKIKKGKDTLKWTFIGAAIVILAVTIISLITTSLANFNILNINQLIPNDTCQTQPTLSLPGSQTTDTTTNQ